MNVERKGAIVKSGFFLLACAALLGPQSFSQTPTSPAAEPVIIGAACKAFKKDIPLYASSDAARPVKTLKSAGRLPAAVFRKERFRLQIRVDGAFYWIRPGDVSYLDLSKGPEVDAVSPAETSTVGGAMPAFAEIEARRTCGE